MIYTATVSPRWPEEGGRTIRFELDTRDARTAFEYGTDARSIAHEVGAAYCDSGSVCVVSRDGRDRFSIAR